MSGDDQELLLEELRESGLRLDREGRWWHRGSEDEAEQPVQHARLALALHRWLDRLEDGRYVIQLGGGRHALVEVEDAPYVVRTIEIDHAGRAIQIYLTLSDETEEELDYASLRVGRDDALYCRVKGRFGARFSRPAYYLIGEMIEEDGPGFVLRAAGERWPILPER